MLYLDLDLNLAHRCKLMKFFFLEANMTNMTLQKKKFSNGLLCNFLYIRVINWPFDFLQMKYLVVYIAVEFLW